MTLRRIRVFFGCAEGKSWTRVYIVTTVWTECPRLSTLFQRNEWIKKLAIAPQREQYSSESNIALRLRVRSPIPPAGLLLDVLPYNGTYFSGPITFW